MILEPNLTRSEFKTIFGYDCKFVALSKSAFDAYSKAHTQAMRATHNEIIALSAKLKTMREGK